MDNRTDFRKPRGPAYLAEQARRVLILPQEIHELGDIPLPLVHTALGIAVCALAVLARPQAVGLRASAILVSLLALATAIVLTVYDRLVYDPEIRPGVEGTALPMAALTAFECVMAASAGLPLRAAAAVAASLVIGGVPHLAYLRAVGREGLMARAARDAAGVAVLLPVMLVGVTPTLQWWSRSLLVLVAAGLVTFDTFRTEAMSPWKAVAAATAAGCLVAAAAALSGSVSEAVTGDGGVRAALLLVIWYGVRGVLGGLAVRPRRLGAALEHVAVVAAAVAVLRYLHR